MPGGGVAARFVYRETRQVEKIREKRERGGRVLPDTGKFLSGGSAPVPFPVQKDERETKKEGAREV